MLDHIGGEKKAPWLGVLFAEGRQKEEAAVGREENPAREPTSSRLRVHATRTPIYFATRSKLQENNLRNAPPGIRPW